MNTKDAIIELTRSMKLAAERGEYGSASDMQRVIVILNRPTEKCFTESKIQELQNKIHSLVGEVVELFNELKDSVTS